MMDSVRNFFFMYIVTLLVLSLAVMATGLDFLSSTSAVAQAMANAGPGLGPVVGPAANFASLAPRRNGCWRLAMLLGRLELSTVYVMLLAAYWRPDVQRSRAAYHLGHEPTLTDSRRQADWRPLQARSRLSRRRPASPS